MIAIEHLNTSIDKNYLFLTLIKRFTETFKVLNLQTRRLINKHRLTMICPDKVVASIIKSKINGIFQFCFAHFVLIKYLPKLNSIADNFICCSSFLTKYQ